MLLVKEFYDFIISVKRRRLILGGYQFNLRLILTVLLNPDAEMLADKTAHRRQRCPDTDIFQMLICQDFHRRIPAYPD